MAKSEQRILTVTTRSRPKGDRASPKPLTIAIAYDFDGTLAPGNMQEHLFIPAIGIGREQFWAEVKDLARTAEADEVLVYMYLMLEKARAARVPVNRSDMRAFGADLKLFHGVQPWFGRINTYGRESGVKIEHYLISSGVKEIVEGSPIGKEFKAVFASSFLYDVNKVPQWPALAINYTTKTQYLFRINKGSLNVSDHTKINAFVPMGDRPVPFTNMIYIGDGDTDIPCFRLVKEQGGHSIAVHDGSAKGFAKSERLMNEGRISFAVEADYHEGRKLDRVVKAIIDKLAADRLLSRLGKHRA